MRNNANFKYSQVGGLNVNSDGFYTQESAEEMKPGGRCCVEHNIPAKQKKGVDGVIIDYSYNVFIERPFRTKLKNNDLLSITMDNGDTILDRSILGIDNTNRRYVEIWL